MNKKGQFYIIIVLVICMALYGVTREENTIKEATLFEDFSQLSANYIEETPKVINYVIKENGDVYTELGEFTEEFLDYAKKRNSNVGIFYVYNDGSGNVELRNYMSETGYTDLGTISGFDEEIIQSVTVEIGGKDFYHQVPVGINEFGEGWYTSSGQTNNFDLTLGGIVHNFDLTDPNIPEFIVILKSELEPEGVSTYIAGSSEEEFEPEFSPNIDESLNEYVTEVRTNE